MILPVSCRDMKMLDDDKFKQLLTYFNLSWSGYRRVRKGVKKRIRRHMRHAGCQDMASYMHCLSTKDHLRQECERLLTVPISRFFRDKRVWTVLSEAILPVLVCEEYEKISIWSAGCACGEEVYSFMIIWNQMKDVYGNLPALDMLATDVNPECLSRAQQGFYTASSLKNMCMDLRQQYLSSTPSHNHYRIRKKLFTGIKWNCRNVLSEFPDTSFHIVFLRNSVLTYYDTPLKERALKHVVNCLSPGGFLIIGSNERLPESIPNLVRSDLHRCVLKKIKNS
jgi:chemotaxis methyl-accepting protein methylase